MGEASARLSEPRARFLSSGVTSRQEGSDVHEKRIEIRWSDMDAFGHVNNATYLTFLEEVRDEWVERTLGEADLSDFVLARVAIDYRRELRQADDLVVARCGLAEVGRSSVHTREELRTVDGELAASATSVLVARDPATGRARGLTDGERSALLAEPLAPPDGDASGAR